MWITPKSQKNRFAPDGAQNTLGAQPPDPQKKEGAENRIQNTEN
jgi:hypothetical protein